MFNPTRNFLALYNRNKMREFIVITSCVALNLNIVNDKTEYFIKWLKIQYLKTVIKNPSILSTKKILYSF